MTSGAGAQHKPFTDLPEKLRHQIYQHPCGCWLWRGRMNRNGYGRQRWRGAEPVVHRLVYELLVSDIPAGHLLDHLRDVCTSRACCNPLHMEPVTPRVNVHRGRAVLFQPSVLGWMHSRGRPRDLAGVAVQAAQLAAAQDTMDVPF